MEEIYDLIILGGGPASMSAGIYAMQTKQKTLLIEKGEFGGQVATTSSVSNYLGFETITGRDLAQKMHEHLVSTGIEITHEEVTKTILTGDIKQVYTHKNCYKSKAVIIGIGTQARKLGVENESKYIGKGLSYSTLNDRDKFENKKITVVGGGNSAIEDAIYLSEKASKVYLIHRRNEFRADQKLVDDLYAQIEKEHKIELCLDCKPQSIEGEKVEKFNILHIPTNETRTLEVDGIFVCIGRGASTDIIDEAIAKNENGYIITNEKMETNLKGVYAVGDIRNTPLRQIVTALSDGAIASMSALNYEKQQA